MGKRELLLILGFIVLGAVVYQATAPPSAPGERGFSLSRIFDHLRREMRSNSASAGLVNSATHDVAPEITELRIGRRNGPLTVTGEDRDTVASELSVRSTGSDDAEARKLAGETVVQYERTGSILFVRVFYPQGGQQTTSLTLTVPARLRVRIEGNTGKLHAGKLAGLELGPSRGETAIEDVDGAVTLQHRGGELRVTRVGSLELTARGSTIHVAEVRGAAVLNVQAGELTASGLTGPVELDTNAARTTIEGLETTAGPIRVLAAGGEVTLAGISADTQIDMRSAELRLAIHRAAVITVINEAGGSIRITPPNEGYRLDARTRNGKIVSEPEALPPMDQVDAPGQRVAGDVNGGGPLLTIRAHGDITFAK